MREIVIVDDEQGITTALAREIRLEFGDEVYKVSTFNNPLEVLPYLEEHRDRVFLTISDLRMPQMNGSELLERIRMQNPLVQTILLTAYTDMENIQRAISSNLQSLLMKPWKQESVVEEIKKAERLWVSNTEYTSLKSRLNRELRSAGEFQARLFSKGIPMDLANHISIAFTPLDEFHCGGDFYDIYTVEKNKYLIICGDVIGHGPKPAIISGILKTALETITETQAEALRDPATLLSELNVRFCRLVSGSPEVLAAMSAVYVDIAGQTLSIATAGLPPVIHIRNGKPELISTPNPVLGVMSEATYYRTERALLPGDVIILVTDGLTESEGAQFNVSLEAMYTLASGWRSYDALAIQDSFKHILPGKTFSDDATVISLKIPGKADE